VKARSEAKTPGGKELAMELEDSDMAHVENWPTLTLVQRARLMQDTVDIMVVDWMVRRGDISKEYGQQRIREIRAGQ
jgi:hypothetical protein